MKSILHFIFSRETVFVLIGVLIGSFINVESDRKRHTLNDIKLIQYVTCAHSKLEFLSSIMNGGDGISGCAKYKPKF